MVVEYNTYILGTTSVSARGKANISLQLLYLVISLTAICGIEKHYQQEHTPLMTCSDCIYLSCLLLGVHILQAPCKNTQYIAKRVQTNNSGNCWQCVVCQDW